MPDDDIDSYWEGLRPRREPTTAPAERDERTVPSRVSVIPFEESIPFIADPRLVNPPIQQVRSPYGIIDRHNPDAGLSTIRSLRQSLQAQALEVQTQAPTDPDLGLRQEAASAPLTNLYVSLHTSDPIEAVQALSESEVIRPERRRPQNTWAEFEPLSIREQRIRNHAYMDGLSAREEPNGNSTLTRLMSSLAALGITGSVGQERLPNGNRAVTILMLPVTDESPHFLVGARVTQNGGVEVVVEFPEE